MDDETDSLVREVLRGRSAAFAGIVRRYQREVWRIAARLLADPAATDDLAQEAFLDAYLHLDQYRPGTDFGAWLRTIAWNRVRMAARKAARAARGLEEYRSALAQADAADRGPDADYLDALEGCRGRLPAPAAEAVRLRYEGGQEFDEIARAQGTTAAAVQRMLSRARHLLRACIEARLDRR